MMWFTYIKA